MFKGSSQNLFYFDFKAAESLGISGETDKSKEQLRNLITKLHGFELSHIHQGGYVQFLHLISQIMVSGMKVDEREKILPPIEVMGEIIKKICG